MPRNKHTYPKEIINTLYNLRANSKNRITLALINNRYCVYEYKYIFDPRTKLKIKKTLYLGWISKDGIMNAARRRAAGTMVKSLDEHIEANYIKENNQEYSLTYPSEIDSLILTSLSMDSRRPTPYIAHDIGISKSAVAYRLRRLQQIYGIKKTIEIYPERFGFTRYAITIKFLNKRPDFGLLKKLFEKEPRVQLVLLMRGGYDLFIYIIAESTEKLEGIIYEMRSDHVFSDCPAVWNVGYMIESYGFVPFRDEFFILLKERVWKRSRESPRRKPDQLFLSEYAVMKELNHDAGINFLEIDKRYNLNRGSAQYTYHKLLKNKLIERATITMLSPHSKYLGLIYIKQLDVLAYNATRIRSLQDVLEETSTPMNKYIFAGDISSPYGVIRIVPIFEVSLEALEYKIKKLLKGIEIETSIVTEILIGQPGYRKFDNKESTQLKLITKLTEHYKVDTSNV
jgi:DNA-binding Lrp family transcriptional regulator